MQILWRPLGVGSCCRSFAKSPFFLSICCFATRYKTPTVCRYVASQLDMFSLCSNSIYFSLRTKFDMLPLATMSAMRSDAPFCYFSRVATIRYISRYARNSICCLRQRESIAPLLLLISRCLLGNAYRARSAISSRRHIERRVSGAYRRRADV